MIMRNWFVFIVFFSFGKISFAQCSFDSVLSIKNKMSECDFYKNYLGGYNVPPDLFDDLSFVKRKWDKKGILIRNRKISQWKICDQVNQISLLLTSIDKIANELKCLDSKAPNDAEVLSAINQFKNKSLNTLEMQKNLDSLINIKGLSSLEKYHQDLYNFLKLKHSQNDNIINSFNDLFTEKQNLDSVQFRFTLDYIPLLVEKRNLQNQLAIELRSLAEKLELYRLRKYK